MRPDLTLRQVQRQSIMDRRKGGLWTVNWDTFDLHHFCSFFTHRLFLQRCYVFWIMFFQIDAALIYFNFKITSFLIRNYICKVLLYIIYKKKLKTEKLMCKLFLIHMTFFFFFKELIFISFQLDKISRNVEKSCISNIFLKILESVNAPHI